MSSESSQQPLPVNHARPSAAALDPAHWLAIDDDVALGCECADPSLQIDEWPQQTGVLPKNV